MREQYKQDLSQMFTWTATDKEPNCGVEPNVQTRRYDRLQLLSVDDNAVT